MVALDGNPVPTPRKVRVLALGVAERIDAVVEMNRPGVWILGTPHDDDRRGFLPRRPSSGAREDLGCAGKRLK